MAISQITGNSIAANTVIATEIVNGSITATQLANTGVTAGTYGDSANLHSITVNAQGQVTAAAVIPLSTDPLPQILMLSGM